MVVHDLRNPADSIREGLEQAQVMMISTFTEIIEETNNFFITRILTENKKKVTTISQHNSSLSGSFISPLRDESCQSKIFSDICPQKMDNKIKDNFSCNVS